MLLQFGKLLPMEERVIAYEAILEVATTILDDLHRVRALAPLVSEVQKVPAELGDRLKAALVPLLNKDVAGQGAIEGALLLTDLLVGEERFGLLERLKSGAKSWSPMLLAELADKLESGSDRQAILELALSEAREIDEPWLRAINLTRVFSRLPADLRPDLVTEILTSIDVIHVHKLDGFRQLLRVTNREECEPVFLQALAYARSLESDTERAAATASIICFALEEAREGLVDEAIPLLSRVDSATDRVLYGAQLVRAMPVSRQAAALEEIWSGVSFIWNEPSYKISMAMQELLPLITNFPLPLLHRLWQELSVRLLEAVPEVVFGTLCSAVPILARLGGVATAREAVRALRAPPPRSGQR